MPEQLVLADAQTSGRPAARHGGPLGVIDALSGRLRDGLARVGPVIEGDPGAIRVEGRLH